MTVKSTRLRFAAATDRNALAVIVSSLPFKVEIKGGPVLDPEGKWVVWFIIPDNVTDKDFPANIEAP